MVSYVTTNAALDTTRLIELDVASHLGRQRHSHSSTTSEDPESLFKSQLSSSVDTLDLIQSPINKVQYRVVSNNSSILLTPILFNSDVIDSSLYQFKINFPDAISQNCITINQFNVNEEDHSIIIDLLTKTGLLITCILKVSDFITPSITSSANYQDWCKISNPYGFDVRKPHILHSINYNCLMVLLKDGGVIGLQRSLEADLFNSIEPVVFNDNSYLQNIKNLLKPWNKVKINDDPELTLSTVVDVLSYENYLITITINKKLRVWSIANKSLLFEKDLSELLNLKNDTGTQFLDSNPTKLLDLLKISDNRSFLTIYFPFNEGAFKLFKIEHSYHEDDFQLIDLGLTLSTSFHDISSIWFIGDFKTIKQDNDDELNLWVLWKSNTSSIIKKLSIKEDLTTHWVDVHSSVARQLDNFKSINSETWTEFYQRKIFQSGNYSNLILETSLRIFQIHFQNPLQQNTIQSSSLLDNVTKTISGSLDFTDANYESSLEKQWKKFDSLCQGFKKHADEPLKFFHFNDSVLLTNRSNFTFIRNRTTLESSSSPSSGKFTVSLSKFTNKLPIEVLSNVTDSIVNLVLNDDFNETTLNSEFVKIFNSHLNNKFNNDFLVELVDELSTVGDVFQIIEDALQLQNSTCDVVVSSKLSELSGSILVNTIKDIVLFNSNQLFEIIILLLVLEFDNQDKLQVIIGQILKTYKIYEFVKKALSITFNDENAVEVNLSTNLNKSILNRLIQKKFNGFKFSNANLLTFISSYVFKFINSLEFQQLLVIELLNTQSYHIIHSQFWSFLNSENPVILLFKAYTLIKLNLPSKASKIFTNSSSFISRYRPTSTDTEVLSRLSIDLDLSQFFQTHLSKYYFLVSELFSSENQYNESLNFINLSIANQSLTEFDSDSHKSRYYAQFQISLQLSNFQLIESSLKQISTNLKKQAISDLIDKLQDNNDLKKLTELKLFEEYYVIDEILYTRAIETEDSFRALYFHKVLYAFRLTYKNKREAMESLYEYIYTRNPERQTKIELYLTILNLLRTLGENDQWILMKLENNEVKEKVLKDLNDEYLALMAN